MSKRLFLAIPILPENTLVKQKKFLQSNLSEERINWIKDENLHLTLKFIGKTPSGKIQEIINAIGTCLQSFNSFPIVLDRLGVFGSKYQSKVIWIGLKENKILQDLYLKISIALENIGIPIDRQNFVPHFSLARIKKINHKDHFQRVMDRVGKGIIQESTVNEIVLFESNLFSDGPVYTKNHSFKLST